MTVSAIIVTRGDHDLAPIIGQDWPEQVQEILVWDNASLDRRDLKVYGRYAAIAEASHPLIWTQDDDVVLPRESIEQILAKYPSAPYDAKGASGWPVVSNMPAAFRDQPQYESGEQSLVGFGACFYRDAPARAFNHFFQREMPDLEIHGADTVAVVAQASERRFASFGREPFLRTCDVVFTALTPRVWVDVPYENLPWATAEDRMYREPRHIEERTRMLDLVRKVRDAA